MLLPTNRISAGKWFLRRSNQSGMDLFSAPNQCVKHSKGQVYFEVNQSGITKTRSCTSNQVVYVSDTFEDLNDIFKSSQLLFKEYEIARLGHVRRAKLHTETAVTLRLVEESARGRIISTLTHIPEDGPVQRYVTLRDPGNYYPAWTLRVYGGHTLVEAVTVHTAETNASAKIMDPDAVRFLEGRQKKLIAAGEKVSLFTRDLQPPCVTTEDSTY